MALDIHIEQVNVKGEKEEVLYFSGVYPIQTFFLSRGVKDNVDTPITLAQVRELYVYLQKELAIAIIENDVRQIDKLDTAVDKMTNTIESLNPKAELIYHCSI